MKNIFYTFILLLSLSLSAQTQDATNRDYLIEKLNKVSLNLSPSDPSRNGIVLRLADLLSERARQNEFSSLDGSCKKCVPPAVDRKKALQYYTEALPKLSESSKLKVLVQMGHLNQLLGSEKNALDLYSRITNEASDGAVKAEAYLAIAEIFFKKSDWKQAEAQYEKSIHSGNSSSKGYAYYRMSWSQFNQGKVSQARANLKTVLTTPAYLSKSGSVESVVDVAFHEQVARDYAVMTAKDFHVNDLKTVQDLSPEKKKLENLFTVASDLESNGKKNEAIQAWNYLYQNQPQPQDRALSKAHLGAVYLELGKNQEASDSFAESYSLISQVKTQFPSETEDVRRLIRASIVTWNQAEKKKPTDELLQTYQGYLSTFGYEKEMSQWAVQIAADLKKWDTAWDIHGQATSTITDSKLLENHLLLGVELGEMSKDERLVKATQDEYLAKSVTKTKYWEVFYQQAYDGYEKAVDESFLSKLEKIVVTKEAPSDLRVKSGDLYLDYLASKKRDSDIEIVGRNFHSKMNGVKGYLGDWAKIAEKSVLNQVAKLVEDKKPNEALIKLQSFQVKNADEKDVVTYYKNKIILSEQASKFQDAFDAAKSLNMLSQANAEDKVFAQAKMAYYSDLQMDFKAAMNFTEQLPHAILSEDKKNLKLALYSDLLGKNSQAYLVKFIETSKDQLAKEAAAYEVISKSNQIDVDIKKYEKTLSSNKELLSEVALSSYLKSGAKSYGNELLKKNPDLKNTRAGFAIYRNQHLKNIINQASVLEKMKFEADPVKKDYQRRLAKDIQDRAKALKVAEDLAAESIKSKDWTLQVVALDLIAKETDRFYSEILSLPIPEQLTPEEQNEYMRLIGEQSAPYKQKSDLAKAKLNDFWNDKSWLESIKLRAQSTESNLVSYEKDQLLKIADEKNKMALTGVVIKTSDAQSTLVADKKILEQLNLAREEVKRDPLNVTRIQNLKSLEVQAGNRAMVQYLDGRIAEINSASSSVNNKGVQ